MGTSPLDKDIIWQNVFQFASSGDYQESLVWRQYAPGAGCVHSLGEIVASNSRSQGRPKTYVGCRTAIVSSVHQYKNKNGHGLKISHAPQEGIQHAHITYEKKLNG